MSFKIQVGCRYLMRNGFITPPLVASTIDGPDYPFGSGGDYDESETIENGNDISLTTWSEFGEEYIHENGTHQSQFDLIQRVTVAYSIHVAKRPKKKTLRLWFVQERIGAKWLPEWVVDGTVPSGLFKRMCLDTCIEGEETI